MSGKDLLALYSRYVDVEALPWAPAAFAGIEQKVLFEDPARGVRTLLMRWAAGAELPMHEHTDVEQTFVLEGSLADHEGECKAGGFVWRPAGSRHRAWSPQGCLLLAIFLKPNTFGPSAV